MNTNYDNEATKYEETVVNNSEETTQETDNAAENSDNQEQTAAEKKKGSTWKSAAASAVTGAAVGVGASVLMGMAPADHEVKPEPGKDDKDDSNITANLVDEDVPVATAVNDDMKFGEAFAAARAEVGPGGVFEWNGNIYHTYTAEEWNAMTPEQQAEFNSNFAWNKHESSSAGNSQETTTQTANTGQTTTPHTNDDDIEIVSVDNDNPSAQTQTAVNTSHSGSEVEVLGVVHDDETGANIAGVTIEGEEVLLVDVDNNHTFDYMVIDADGNGEVSENEVVDIQDGGVTVDSLGGFSDPSANMLAENDGPDYINDAAVYDA